MKIAILGSGISSYVLVQYLKYLNSVSSIKIDIVVISEKPTGDFFSGGLKYIHASKNLLNFCRKIIGIEPNVKSVVGAVVWGDNIYNFPEFVVTSGKGEKIQKEHWMKTRGDSEKFSNRCMNDPFNYHHSLAVTNFPEFIGVPPGVKYIVKKMNLEDVVDLSLEYDFVISTIPSEYLGMRCKWQRMNLYFAEFYNPFSLDKIWWDYLYTPSVKIPYHRVSKNNGTLTFESYNKIYSSDITDFVDYLDFLSFRINSHKRFLDLRKEKYTIKNCVIKGHILDSEIKPPMDNVILLGRYAQADSRITLDKVVDRIVDFIIPKIMRKHGQN